MGLEANAYTVASHTVMVLILGALIWRALWCLAKGLAVEVIKHGLLPAICICATSLIIERIFYICARVLRPRGIDLWSLHPAPETLSLVVGMGFYGIMIPMIHASNVTARRAKAHIFLEVIFLMIVWGTTVAVLF